MAVSNCRACAGRSLSLILDLGLMPPSRRFLTPELACCPEPIQPLRLHRCENCGLLQLDETTRPEPPLTALPEPLPAAQAFARRLVERFRLRPVDTVLAIADGNMSLSAAFQNFNVHSLSIPSSDLLHQCEYGSAKVVLAFDSLSATDDPHAFLRGLERVLADDGVAILDGPNLHELHDQLSYDLVCHETRSYFSMTLMARLLERHGLEPLDVEEAPEHSGMSRLTVQRRGGPLRARPAVSEEMVRERTDELDRPQAWVDFAMLVEQSRDLLNSELEEWQYRSRPVTAYSTGGRGMTMLAYCGAAPLRLPYLVDECPSLHGLLTPGHRIPIVGPDHLRRQRPEAVLLLGRAWDAAGEGPLHDYWHSGGRVLVPLPKPHYVDPAPAPHNPRLRDTIVPGLSFSDIA